MAIVENIVSVQETISSDLWGDFDDSESLFRKKKTQNEEKKQRKRKKKFLLWFEVKQKKRNQTEKRKTKNNKNLSFLISFYFSYLIILQEEPSENPSENTSEKSIFIDETSFSQDKDTLDSIISTVNNDFKIETDQRDNSFRIDDRIGTSFQIDERGGWNDGFKIGK